MPEIKMFDARNTLIELNNRIKSNEEAIKHRKLSGS